MPSSEVTMDNTRELDFFRTESFPGQSFQASLQVDPPQYPEAIGMFDIFFDQVLHTQIADPEPPEPCPWLFEFVDFEEKDPLSQAPCETNKSGISSTLVFQEPLDLDTSGQTPDLIAGHIFYATGSNQQPFSNNKSSIENRKPSIPIDQGRVTETQSFEAQMTCFPGTAAAASGQHCKKRKYDPPRRQEVALMRKIKPCTRCKIRKVSVSLEPEL